MNTDDVENFFKHIGLNKENHLEHFGKKGMRWGHRNAQDTSSDNMSVRQGRKELKNISKTAGSILKEADNAKTPAQKKAAADRYQKEVYDRVRSPEFKKAFKKANTVTKGDVAVRVIAFGPLGLLSVKSMKAAALEARTMGPKQEEEVSKAVLKELRA